jgi:hypothetical protein
MRMKCSQPQKAFVKRLRKNNLKLRFLFEIASVNFFIDPNGYSMPNLPAPFNVLKFGAKPKGNEKRKYVWEMTKRTGVSGNEKTSLENPILPSEI